MSVIEETGRTQPAFVRLKAYLQQADENNMYRAFVYLYLSQTPEEIKIINRNKPSYLKLFQWKGL